MPSLAEERLDRKKDQMTETQMEWRRARERLVAEIRLLGFPEELGYEVAKNLGSPKAMNRMVSYLKAVQPKKAEIIVDEMLSIMSEIQAWREKKESEAANAKYNEFLNTDFSDF